MRPTAHYVEGKPTREKVTAQTTIKYISNAKKQREREEREALEPGASSAHSIRDIMILSPHVYPGHSTCHIAAVVARICFKDDFMTCVWRTKFFQGSAPVCPTVLPTVVVIPLIDVENEGDFLPALTSMRRAMSCLWKVITPPRTV